VLYPNSAAEERISALELCVKLLVPPVCGVSCNSTVALLAGLFLHQLPSCKEDAIIAAASAFESGIGAATPALCTLGHYA
jgi:hypothetical protein